MRLGDLLQHALARLIPRMGLTRKNELHGPLRIVHHRREAFDVCQDQIRTLIGCEPPREADGQCIRSQHPAESAAALSGDSPRRSACSTARRRTNSSSRNFRLRCVSQSSPSSTSQFPPIYLRRRCSCQPVPRWRSYRRDICGASQDGTCTPFVIWPIGTASSFCPDRVRSTSRGKPRHAAPIRRLRAARV